MYQSRSVGCRDNASDPARLLARMSWLAGRRSGSQASTVVCHFCGQQYALQQQQQVDRNFRKGKGKSVDRGGLLQVVSGSWSSFQCPSCESWNLRDPRTGEFVDDAQIYGDPALNAGPSSLRTTSNFKQTQDAVFCRDCLTNQNLQVQLLAGYLPASAPESEEARLLARLPAYRDSLDDRYPLACARCQGRVESVIEERNWKAKARTVGGWLKKSAGIVNAQPNLASASIARSHHIWLWRLKGVAWKTLYLATASIAALERLQPYIPRKYAQHVPVILKTRQLRLGLGSTFAFLSLFISFWNPAYRERLRRGSAGRTIGKQRWLALQGILYLSRVGLAIWAAWLGISLPVQATTAISASHLAVLLARNQLIYVSGPRRARLREQASPARSRSASPSRRSSIPQSSSPARPIGRSHSPQRAQAIFGKLSLGQTPRSARAHQRNGYRLAEEPMDTDEIEHDEEAEHTMLWQSEAGIEVQDVDMLDLADQPGQSGLANIDLRPAVFNPPDDRWNLASTSAVRGLERLFEQGVSLQDSRTVDEGATSQAGFGFRTIVAMSVLAGSIAALGAVYVYRSRVGT